ncbi:hypothetical protein AB0L53_38340 [Nonomuraea sp. NPDC052129]|uniref:hypothetical protein n=1 Tax=Nonomuraea sp. NPDC052129 TaxID=3154651 RepID=UPI00341DA4CB
MSPNPTAPREVHNRQGVVSSRYVAALSDTTPSTEVTLLALHTAISIGAQVGRFTARHWGLLDLEDTAEQVGTHLIARAVETTGNPDPNFRYTDLDLATVRAVGIRVHRRAAALIIDVWDSDPTTPLPAPGGSLDHHLAAVHALARRWRWYPAPCGGKVIWAELTPPDHHQPGQAPYRLAGGLPIIELRHEQAETCACHGA